MIIDSHLYVYAAAESLFPYVVGGKPAPPAAVEYLLPLMKEAGGARAVIVQPRTYSWDNRYRSIRNYKNIFSQVKWCGRLFTFGSAGLAAFAPHLRPVQWTEGL